ncbi:hypothetical protein DH2020_012895 [Rehmannia glutinosa]|uniref:galactinol--sucrose galactosyltransferase n=1 Tax=Rehmannia glutinosa TaxID=99300 RepID=A0ABR0X379_REHGL
MTITATPLIKNGCLMVRDKVVLTKVPENVVISSPATSGSAFIGANSSTLSSRHVFNLGILENSKLMCLFILKFWWMIPRFGKSASEIPVETQMLLLEAGEESTLSVENDDTIEETGSQNKFYILVLAVLDGAFRTTLQGTPSNELHFCYESGDPEVQTCEALEGVFVNSGENPFELIKDSIKCAPAHLDWFGWCTWDAFYTDVTPNGIKQGLQSFKDGGISPKFLIIDDGWQEMANEYHQEGEALIEGTQYSIRLTDIKENSKFRGSKSDGSSTNLKELIYYIKENYGLKYVYIWHTIIGYWGGLLASSEALKKYDPKIEYPVQSPGHIGNVIDKSVENLEKYGLGLIDPQKVFDFYNDMHRYLAGSGVDGVKADGQNILGTLGSGYGGRVSIAKQYLEALDESIEKNFSARALGGCPVYVSDKPGKHDFNILKKLVLPDGSILRARYAGRPTRDCLFIDPVMDGERGVVSLSLSLVASPFACSF